MRSSDSNGSDKEAVKAETSVASETKPEKGPNRRRGRIVGLILFLVMLTAGLLAGTESTLIVKRADNGSVTAVNARRFAGRVTLVKRTVHNLREVKFQEKSLNESERRTYTRSRVPEEMVLVGDGQLSYSYREDFELIRAFLENKQTKDLVLRHPRDIRGTVLSIVMLVLCALIVIGWVIEKALGRDPWKGMDRKVKPLPPRVGQALFVGVIILCFWFVTNGHHIFGPLATKKVDLLFKAAHDNSAAGIDKAARRGVFIDVRDNQTDTAFMVAATYGATDAARALLKAGASPDLRRPDNDTALTLALRTRHPDVALLLLEGGADIAVADNDGSTPLHLAVDLGDTDLIRRIVKGGAKVDQADVRGWTPLMLAASGGKDDAVRELLDAGADPNRRSPEGWTVSERINIRR